MRHRAKFHADRTIRCGYVASFRFFKMAAVRHIGFVIGILGYSRRVLVGLCHSAKFGCNR